MPLLALTKPSVVKFLTENYQKENNRRLAWSNKNKEIILQAATLTREPSNYYETDVSAHIMREGLPATTREHIVAGFYKKDKPIRDGTFIPGIKNLRRGHSILDVGLGDPKDDPRIARPDSDLTSDPIMRPVDPNLTKIIYKPQPAFGRLEYLKKRSKIGPENKYYFPECSSFDCGWRLKDSLLNEKAFHGRCWHLTRALKNRVGPKPDPPHYKSPEQRGRSNCNDV